MNVDAALSRHRTRVFFRKQKCAAMYGRAFWGFFSGFLLILWDKDGVSLCYWDKIKA